MLSQNKEKQEETIKEKELYKTFKYWLFNSLNQKI